jgi:hypothetical protein
MHVGLEHSIARGGDQRRAGVKSRRAWVSLLEDNQTGGPVHRNPMPTSLGKIAFESSVTFQTECAGNNILSIAAPMIAEHARRCRKLALHGKVRLRDYGPSAPGRMSRRGPPSYVLPSRGGFTSSRRSGSPQCASTATRTASRNRKIEAKSVPSGVMASSI